MVKAQVAQAVQVALKAPVVRVAQVVLKAPVVRVVLKAPVVRVAQVLLELRHPHLSERRLLLLEMVLAVPALARVDLEICSEDLEAQVVQTEWEICSAARVQTEWVICLVVQVLLELRPPHLSGLRLRLLEMVLAVPALARAVLVLC